MIGLAAALLLATRGRIAGISGIVGGIVDGASKQRGGGSFVLGLFAGGVLSLVFAPQMFGAALTTTPSWVLVVGGLLVGFGTRLGRGCTSGHGVCGIARGSRTSLVATVVFMAFAMLTVFVTRHLIGGAG